MPTDDDSDDGSVSTNALKYIWDGIQIHPKIKAIDTRSKICDYIKRMQSKWKNAELSEKNMGKVLHKVFMSVVNELNNSMPTLI